MEIFRTLLDIIKASYHKVKQVFSKSGVKTLALGVGALSCTVISVQCFTVSMLAPTATATILAAVIGGLFLSGGIYLYYSLYKTLVQGLQSPIQGILDMPIPQCPEIV